MRTYHVRALSYMSRHRCVSPPIYLPTVHTRESLLATVPAYLSFSRMPLKSEYELGNPPNDGITRVTFAPISQSPLLLVSSWDTGVRMYDVSTPEGSMRSMYSHQFPVLDCTLVDATRSFSGGLDRCLKTYDFQASREDVLGEYRWYSTGGYATSPNTPILHEAFIVTDVLVKYTAVCILQWLACNA